MMLNEFPAIDGETRIKIEKAKEAARVDFGYTCFKGKTHFSKSQLANSMWLARRKQKEIYI